MPGPWGYCSHVTSLGTGLLTKDLNATRQNLIGNYTTAILVPNNLINRWWIIEVVLLDSEIFRIALTTGRTHLSDSSVAMC